MSTTFAEPHLILGVRSQPTYEELQRAYRSKVRLAHPDHGGNAEHFDRLHRAYEQMRQNLRPVRRDVYVVAVPSTPRRPAAPTMPVDEPQRPAQPSSHRQGPDPRVREILRLLRLKTHYARLREEYEGRKRAEEAAFLARFGLKPKR